MKPGLNIADGRLRPSTPDDLESLLALLHQREVRRFLCDDKVLPRETVAGMLDRSKKLDARGLGLWVIERSDQSFAGIAGLQPVPAETGTSPTLDGAIEAIIALDRGFWGQGLASQALCVLIDYASDTLELSSLVAIVDRPNEASHRLIKRHGFSATGRMSGPAEELVLYKLSLRGAKALK